jgi:hypothetical protein
MKRSRTTFAALATMIALTTLILAAGGGVQARSQLIATGGPTCDDHPNQASAQRARDTRDADGDGIYCVIYSG